LSLGTPSIRGSIFLGDDGSAYAGKRECCCGEFVVGVGMVDIMAGKGKNTDWRERCRRKRIIIRKNVVGDPGLRRPRDIDRRE
jgi:hypothetical protein